MTDDAENLRQFCETRSEAAFGALVECHLGMVYRSAVRQLQGDAHLAEDICQMVFVLLAEKSRGLVGHPSLAGWLYTATHHKITEVTRAERRRRAREQDAARMEEVTGGEATSLEESSRLRLMLDQALLKLGERDREAILLRFFENQPYASIATRTGSSENTAHKRVERALDRLRNLLARRGITSSAEVLAALLATEAVSGCPPGLVLQVTGAAISLAAPPASVGFLAFLSATPTMVGVAVLTGVMAVCLVLHDLEEAHGRSEALVRSQQETGGLTEEVRELNRKVNALADDQLPTRFLLPSSGTTAIADRAIGQGASSSSERAARNAELNRNGEVHAALGRLVALNNARYFEPLIATANLSPAQRERAEYLNGQLTIFGFGPLIDLSFKTDPAPWDQLSSELQQILGPTAVAAANTYLIRRYVVESLAGELYDTATPLTAEQASQLTQVVTNAIAPASPKGVSWSLPQNADWSTVLTQATGFLSSSQVARLNAVAIAHFEGSRP